MPTPETEVAAAPAVTVSVDGAVIAGGESGAALTVTATDFAGAVPPAPSLALIVIVSVPAEKPGSDRVSVPRSLFTCVRLPVIVRLLVPEPLTPAPVAERLPAASVKVTVIV